jgi:hypothetical protein
MLFFFSLDYLISDSLLFDLLIFLLEFSNFSTNETSILSTSSQMEAISDTRSFNATDLKLLLLFGVEICEYFGGGNSGGLVSTIVYGSLSNLSASSHILNNF